MEWFEGWKINWKRFLQAIIQTHRKFSLFFFFFFFFQIFIPGRLVQCKHLLFVSIFHLSRRPTLLLLCFKRFFHHFCSSRKLYVPRFNVINKYIFTMAKASSKREEREVAWVLLINFQCLMLPDMQRKAYKQRNSLMIKYKPKFWSLLLYEEFDFSSFLS